ncbi:hypothetical protein Tco_0586299 [Tanacetum coccineum]
MVADTDCLPYVCCESALSACVLKHPGRSQLVSGLSGSSYVLLCWAWAQMCIVRIKPDKPVIRTIRRETCEMWTPLGLSSSDWFDYVVHLPNYIKSVLTQKGLDMFCHKFYIPEDVHLQLPRPNQTIHEMPAGKIVIAAAKVSHFEILCRVHNIEPMVGLFRCFYVNSKNKGWISFSKRPDSDAVYMDLFAFNPVADPTKVKVGERERVEEEAKLLESNVGHVVPLLPVTPARADSELEASLDMLFDEGGSTDQGDSAAGGGQDDETELVTGVRIIADENVVAEKPKRGDYGTSSGVATSGKSPSVLKELLASSMLNVEAGAAAVATLPMVTSSVSGTAEHESGVSTDSITGVNLHTISASKRFVISSDSSHYSSTNASGAEGDSIISFAVVPPVITEAVVTSHAVNAPLVSKMGTKVTSPVHASMFHDSDSTETVKVDDAGPSYSAKQDLSMGSQELNAKTLYQIYEMDYQYLFIEFNVGIGRQACININAEVRMRTEYCLSKRKRLESKWEKQADLLKAKDDEVENLKAQLLLKETKAAEAARLCAQDSVTEATEKMHVAEIDALKQRNVALENEKDSLDGKFVELQSLVSAKDLELKDLNVVVSTLSSYKDGIVDQVHALETTCSGLRDQVSRYKRLKEQIEEFQVAQMNIVNDKVAKLDADLQEMTLHLEEKFYPHLLTTISGQRWLLTHGLKLSIVKCLNSQEYLSALGAAISRAIEKGMQDGPSAGIVHGKEGRSLVDIAAYNPDAEVDYNSALHRFREVDLPLFS